MHLVVIAEIDMTPQQQMSLSYDNALNKVVSLGVKGSLHMEWMGGLLDASIETTSRKTRASLRL